MSNMQEIIDAFGKAALEIGKALTDATKEPLEKIAEAIRDIIEPIQDLIAEICEEIHEAYFKTKPPRDIVRKLGCKPVTQCTTMRIHRVQRR